jgi:drug/metabolite transporter (DMT)-like permease
VTKSNQNFRSDKERRMFKTTQLIASFITMIVLTIGGVLLFFRPIADSDIASNPWPAPIALAVYSGLSILLMDWAAQRLKSSYAAAFIVAGAQVIFIIDLLARGERGYLTALAGVVLVAATWVSVAFVHSRFTREA